MPINIWDDLLRPSNVYEPKEYPYPQGNSDKRMTIIPPSNTEYTLGPLYRDTDRQLKGSNVQRRGTMPRMTLQEWLAYEEMLKKLTAAQANQIY